MAQRGRPIPVSLIRRIRLAVALGLRRAARDLGVSRNTVRKYARPASGVVN